MALNLMQDRFHCVFSFQQNRKNKVKCYDVTQSMEQYQHVHASYVNYPKWISFALHIGLPGHKQTQQFL